MGLLYFGQRKLIYFPGGDPGPAPAGMSEVALETSDGLRLKGWLSPPAGSGQGADLRVAVLVANGNGGSRGDRVPLARALNRNGLTVLLFDYRGYGGNPGRPTESGLFKDIRAAYGYLVSVFEPDRILIYGESLGTAAATDLATEHPARGLVLRSPFIDLASVGVTHYPFLPVRLLLRDRFPLMDKIPAVKSPITVIYGTADTIIPPAQSIAVAERAAVKPIAIAGANHNDQALLDGPDLITAIVAAATRTP